MTIELPPLYGTAHGYACEAVEARERILTARIAELEADAARYRWLRDAHDVVLRWGDGPFEPGTVAEIDAAIDAAMAKGAKP